MQLKQTNQTASDNPPPPHAVATPPLTPCVQYMVSKAPLPLGMSVSRLVFRTADGVHGKQKGYNDMQTSSHGGRVSQQLLTGGPKRRGWRGSDASPQHGMVGSGGSEAPRTAHHRDVPPRARYRLTQQLQLRRLLLWRHLELTVLLLWCRWRGPGRRKNILNRCTRRASSSTVDTATTIPASTLTRQQNVPTPTQSSHPFNSPRSLTNRRSNEKTFVYVWTPLFTIEDEMSSVSDAEVPSASWCMGRLCRAQAVPDPRTCQRRHGRRTAAEAPAAPAATPPGDRPSRRSNRWGPSLLQLPLMLR